MGRVQNWRGRVFSLLMASFPTILFCFQQYWNETEQSSKSAMLWLKLHRIPSSTWGSVWTLSKAFQYKVLNSILFSNKKLCKIGYVQDDKCSLCKTDSKYLYHIFFECRHTKQFWKEFQHYFYPLTREFTCLTLQDVITGILCTNCPLLNYLILYLWGCRRNQTLPIITAFSSKIKIKYETDQYICVKTNKMDKFDKKWVLPLDSVP